jgi:16S rRNA G966 N2-methylase RsmD
MPENPTTTTTPAAKQQEERFDRAYLTERARKLFGASPAMVAGALSRGGNKTYTIEQATKLVKDHRRAEVSHAGGEE